MSEEDSAEEEVEAPPEEPEPDTQEAAMLHFGSFIEKRRALPWEQKTRMEKVSYYMDRVFFACAIIFVIAMVVDFSYKMWSVTDVQKIKEFVSYVVSWRTVQKVTRFVSDFASWLNLPKIKVVVSDFVSWLFTQEKEERKIEF